MITTKCKIILGMSFKDSLGGSDESGGSSFCDPLRNYLENSELFDGTVCQHDM